MKKKNFLPTYKTFNTIVAGLEAVDGQTKFKERDLWGIEGGGGRTCNRKRERF
jgi:coproporphyrinogen III oxidase